MARNERDLLPADLSDHGRDGRRAERGDDLVLLGLVEELVEAGASEDADFGLSHDASNAEPDEHRTPLLDLLDPVVCRDCQVTFHVVEHCDGAREQRVVRDDRDSME
jgi:hypothetical protein